MAHPKRFYTEVSLGKEGGVLLDGKPVKTRSGQILRHGSYALMQEIAREWEGCEKEINYAQMPLTRLLMAALEMKEAERSALIEHVLGYATTDTSCYLTGEDPVLAAKQAAAYQPWHEWLAKTHRVIFHSTSEIMPALQPQESLFRLRDYLESLPGEHLVALNELTAALGSVVLALAIMAGVLEAQEGFRLSVLEALHQETRWGVDAESAARRSAKEAEVLAAHRFITLTQN